MRPIQKGKAPQQYGKYGDAKMDLYKRLKLQCCYCEQHTKLENIAVEHVYPKKIHDGCKLCWNNFLLSCTLCNSMKKDTDIFFYNEKKYLFPDRDDTYHRINYEKSNGYQPIENRNYADYNRAENTLRLYIHDTPHPTRKHIFMVTERASLWKKEGDAATEMKEFYEELKENKQKEKYIKQISERAEKDCWSIWMKTFEGNPEVKEAILYALPNTAIEYFIDDYWEHEQFFKEQHSLTEYFNRLITVIKIRIAYIETHLEKLSDIQKEGIAEWTDKFIHDVLQKIHFSKDQIIRVDVEINKLKSFISILR